MKSFPDWFYAKNHTHVDVAKVTWGHGQERVQREYEEWLLERLEYGKHMIKKKLQEDTTDAKMYEELGGC